MDILKKNNWWVWLIFTIFTAGFSTLILGALLDCYDKNAWYAKWQYWFLGVLFCVIPSIIMIIVLTIQITCAVAAKLGVNGKEIYTSPYTWLLCIIVPALGWSIFIVLLIYLILFIIIKIGKGNAEIYIK